MKVPRILIVAGGTGGHLYPGISVAEAFDELGLEVDLTFLITGKEMEVRALKSLGHAYVTLKAQGVKGMGPISQLKGLLRSVWAVLSSFFILRHIRPDVVLGMGAYVSGPICLAARLMGIKVAIHEQNSFPGLTNRLLSRIADRVFISFEESARFFKLTKNQLRKMLLTGNPIRKGLRSKAPRSVDQKRPCIMVLGGSQGAKAVNEVVLSSMGILKGQVSLPHIIHLTGNLGYEEVLRGYGALQIPAEVYAFRTDMEAVYERATLAISRAGAGSVFELAYYGIPSILIPYPFAANRHQHLNAQALVNIGAAVLLDQQDMTPEGLSGLIKELILDKDRLSSMSLAAMAFSRPDAAQRIAQELYGLIEEVVGP